MKANELRIGNLVYCWNPFNGKYETIISINWKHIRNMVEQPEDETYKSILLTEEWLIKFGFEHIPNKDYFTLYLSDKDENEFGRQRIDYWFGEDDFAAAELCRAGVCFKRVKIKYVHQLQNLYFALTGEELELKQ